MASLEDLKAKLEAIQADMPAMLLQVATVVSLTAKALAETTIQNKGFGAMYSDTKVPAWFMTGKELSGAGKAFIEKKEEENEYTNWKEFREAQGLQTNFVDLTYSVEMWSGMFPKDPIQNGTKFLAPLGHNNTAGQDKMNWNRKRYGDFIGKALAGENFDTMGKTAIDEFSRLIKERHNL